MATQAWQVKLNFAQYGATWAETFYSTSNLAPAALAAAWAANPGGLITNFRHPATVLTGASVRQVPSGRISAIALSNANPPSSITPSSPGADLTQTSVPVTINASGGGSRKLWVRGLPDASTLRSPVTGTTNFSVLGPGINAYVQSIVNGAGCLQHKVPAPNSGAFSWQNVVTIQQSTDNPQWTEVIAAGGSIIPAPGTLVYFRGFLNGTFTYLRGNFIVKSNPALPAGNLNFAIAATYREKSATNFSNVQYRQYTYSYDAMASDFSLGQLSTRKTNDPTTKRRGRRSKATRRLLTLVAQ